MPRLFVPRTLFALFVVTVPAAADADPIILSNSTGIAALAYVSEGGVSERQSVPFATNNYLVRPLTPTVGDTSAVADAFVSANWTSPSRMAAQGGAAAGLTTTEGNADVSAAAQFAVTFQLTTPHAYALSADFLATGDLSRDPFITDRGRWDILLVKGTSAMFANQGYGREFMDRGGILTPGVYRFLVESSSIASNAFGPAFVRSSSSFGFTMNFTEQPTPAPVPEPASMLLLGTGLVGTLAAARRRR